MNIIVVLLILLALLHLPPSLRRSFPISIFLPSPKMGEFIELAHCREF